MALTNVHDNLVISKSPKLLFSDNKETRVTISRIIFSIWNFWQLTWRNASKTPVHWVANKAENETETHIDLPDDVPDFLDTTIVVDTDYISGASKICRAKQSNASTTSLQQLCTKTQRIYHRLWSPALKHHQKVQIFGNKRLTFGRFAWPPVHWRPHKKDLKELTRQHYGLIQIWLYCTACSPITCANLI